MDLLEAKTKNDFDSARVLFREYIDSLTVDLTFQNIKNELANIESIYSRPTGVLILAKEGNSTLGCIALRKIDHCTCEMK